MVNPYSFKIFFIIQNNKINFYNFIWNLDLYLLNYNIIIINHINFYLMDQQIRGVGRPLNADRKIDGKGL